MKQVLGVGDTRATMIIEGGVQVDIRAVAPESYGAALQYFTGSKQHNVHLRTIARKHGLKINEYGVFRGEKRLGGADEEDVYRLLKMQTIPPEMREDRGEIEAAIAHELPTLIEFTDIRGDLHAHTNYSDGRSQWRKCSKEQNSSNTSTSHSRTIRPQPESREDSIKAVGREDTRIRKASA